MADIASTTKSGQTSVFTKHVQETEQQGDESFIRNKDDLVFSFDDTPSHIKLILNGNEYTVPIRALTQYKESLFYNVWISDKEGCMRDGITLTIRDVKQLISKHDCDLIHAKMLQGVGFTHLSMYTNNYLRMPPNPGNILVWMSLNRTNRHWRPFFEQKCIQDILNNIESHIRHEDFCPHVKDIFKAFKYSNPDNIKVVILGMDPYQSRVRGVNRANGIPFSTDLDELPKSLGNIYREMMEDGYGNPPTSDLTFLLKEGVMLLNSALTVKYNVSGSHNRKWKGFTKELIQWIVSRCRGNGYDCAFLLWGKKAQSVAKDAKVNIDGKNVFSATHPSPLSAYRGFFGCRHFSKCNAYLESVGQKVINWSGL